MSVCIRMHVCLLMRVHVRVPVCVRVRVRVRVCVCVCVYRPTGILLRTELSAQTS